MKKMSIILVFMAVCLSNTVVCAETDSISCIINMYPKATVGCQTYVGYAGNAPDNATFIWNFDGGVIISGSGKGPYIIQWDTAGYKTVILYVSYMGNYCNTSKSIYVANAPLVFNVTGGGNYPVGGTGVHIGLSGSQLNYSYYLFLNGGTTSVASKPGDGSPIDFGLFTAPGTYKCKAKIDSSSMVCATLMNGNAVVTVSYVPTQYICIVKYDTTTQRNLIAWNKMPGPFLDHFNIYRQTYQENIFAKIGEVPYNNFSIYLDTTANPLMMAYKYEISVTDSANNESARSPFHKTIHLEVSPGVAGFNLIWNPYEGFTYLTYRIHRKVESGQWEIIDSVASDLISYTDPYITSGLAAYYIEVIRYVPCNRSSNADGYESVVSNTGTSAPLGINDNSELGILIYPNPVRQKLTIVIPASRETGNRVELCSADGRIYLEKVLTQPKTECDISGLPSGLYFLKIMDHNTITVKKIIRE
jgi:hypothetical protein